MMTIFANGILLLVPEAIAHDPQGMASAANKSALIAVIVFLLFVAAAYRFGKRIARGKSRKIRILAMLTFVLVSLALSTFVIYPAIFFIIM